jgi:hypothetical protein
MTQALERPRSSEDQIVVYYDRTWEQFRHIQKGLEDHPGVRLSFYAGANPASVGRKRVHTNLQKPDSRTSEFKHCAPFSLCSHGGNRLAKSDADVQECNFKRLMDKGLMDKEDLAVGNCIEA